MPPQQWFSPIALRGRTIHLVPLAPRHAPGLFAAATPDLFTLAPQAPAEWSIDGFARDIDALNALPNAVAFAIIHAPTQTVIGRTAYLDIRPDQRRLEIGRTWIARSHHGTAANPESKYLLLRHAFEDRAALRIQLTAASDNAHSLRAIAKLGATREATLRSYALRADGTTRDMVVSSITAADWPTLKPALEHRLHVPQAPSP